jgi:uracil-DNA glycosylase
VIIGQDPYHGPNQAHGLCFSVQAGIKPPPSLENIFKELHEDIGMPTPNHGNLEKWAQQGVLLLNAVLTVEAGKPQSHANIGWEIFTDKIIRVLNEEKQGLIFLLWGSPAQKKGSIINSQRHHILKAPHPSPLSASRGFFGCRHFSKTNDLLRKMGKEPIDWSL